MPYFDLLQYKAQCREEETLKRNGREDDVDLFHRLSAIIEREEYANAKRDARRAAERETK